MKKSFIFNRLLFGGAVLSAVFLVSSRTSHAASTNLIVNPSLETANGSLPANWSQGLWGNNTTAFEYPVAGHTGNAAKVTVTAYTDGDAKWYFDNVPVTAGTVYDFSDWSNASVNTDVSVRFHMADGTDSYAWLGTVPGTNTWTQFYSPITVPTGVVSLTVFHVLGSNGSLMVDDYSLTQFIPDPINPAGNLVSNPSLETLRGNLPSGWTKGQWGNNTTAFEYPVAGHTGNAAKITMNSHVDGDAKWYFDNVPVTAGTVYDFSDWSNASVNTDVSVRFHMADGTDSYAWLGTVPGTNTWTQFYSPITVPTGVVSLTVFHVLGSNGSLMVDDYSLTQFIPDPINPAGNLVSNPSLETLRGNLPSGWTKGQWGNNTTTFSYPVAGHTGNAAKITVSAYTDGDAKWHFKDVPVTAGNLYAFSNWSNASADTAVTARVHMTDGTDQYIGLGRLTGTNAWKQFTASFTAPVGAASVSIFHLISAKGTLLVDDYSLLDKGVAPKFAEGMISFTFDDGYRSVYTNGLPILDKAGIKSTQAIITTGTYTDPAYMTKDQVKAMAANGHEIASHSRTHPDLVTLSLAKATTEITGSKSDLLGLGITTTSFMYPLGSYNDSIISLVKGAGYKGARSTDLGYNSPSSDPYRLLSQNVNSDVSIGTIKGWIDKAVADKTWLILTLHEQAVLPNIPDNLYSNDPAILQQTVDYVKSKSMKTVTFGEGVSMLVK